MKDEGTYKCKFGCIHPKYMNKECECECHKK
jgi:hypothetical protein